MRVIQNESKMSAVTINKYWFGCHRRLYKHTQKSFCIFKCCATRVKQGSPDIQYHDLCDRIHEKKTTSVV